MREGRIRLSLRGLLDCELLHLFAEFLRSNLCSSIFPPTSLWGIKSLPTLLNPSLYVALINCFACWTWLCFAGKHPLQSYQVQISTLYTGHRLRKPSFKMQGAVGLWNYIWFHWTQTPAVDNTVLCLSFFLPTFFLKHIFIFPSCFAPYVSPFSSLPSPYLPRCP